MKFQTRAQRPADKAQNQRNDESIKGRGGQTLPGNIKMGVAHGMLNCSTPHVCSAVVITKEKSNYLLPFGGFIKLEV